MTITQQDEQHMAALKLANQIRLDRANLRIRVRAIRDYDEGCAELGKLLQDPPACMTSLRIELALRWVRQIQHPTIVACLAAADCSPWKKVGELSDRQRKVIASWLIETKEADSTVTTNPPLPATSTSRTPERVVASPSSLPDADRGHGVFITVYSSYGYEGNVFLDRDQAVVLRDEIDAAIERTGVDRAA